MMSCVFEFEIGFGSAKRISIDLLLLQFLDELKGSTNVLPDVT